MWGGSDVGLENPFLTPETIVGLYVLVGGVVAALATLAGGWLRNRYEHRQALRSADQASAQSAAADLAERFEDASELSRYIDERVEAKVAPLREELKRVKQEHHEERDAFRAWVTSIWLWDQRGRRGDLPMPPAGMLSRLGLQHYIDEWPTTPDAGSSGVT